MTMTEKWALFAKSAFSSELREMHENQKCGSNCASYKVMNIAKLWFYGRITQMSVWSTCITDVTVCLITLCIFSSANYAQRTEVFTLVKVLIILLERGLAAIKGDLI